MAGAGGLVRPERNCAARNRLHFKRLRPATGDCQGVEVFMGTFAIKSMALRVSIPGKGLTGACLYPGVKQPIRLYPSSEGINS